jgi:1-phosphofructokinase family hexose kinase
MIVSVTANTTLDHTVYAPKFAPYHTVRASQSTMSMGGKPTDASWMLGELGIPSLALGFAAGVTGQYVETLLHEKGVTTDFIEVGGRTRINTVIVFTDGTGQFTVTTSTLEVTPAHVEALRQKYIRALDEATCVVLGGTLPKGMSPSFYTDFIALARERDIPVVFDADEPNLSAGLAAHPTLCKPNHDELGALFGRTIETVEEAYTAGRELLAKYGTWPVITLGAKGGLAVLPDKAYFIPPLKVDLVSSSGAGDGVLTGITAAMAQRKPIEEGLRLGFATATAVLLHPTTGYCERQDIECFLPQIELVPYP